MASVVRSHSEYPIDVLVNNAGTGFFGEHVGQRPDDISKMLQLNVTAVAQLCVFFRDIRIMTG